MTVRVILLLFTLLCVTACDAGQAQQLPSEDMVVLKSGSNAQIKLSVEVADTPYALQRGMMFRTEVKPNTGMIFVFPDYTERWFWMKNTLVPLDMLFIDDTGMIVTIHPNAVPHDETPVKSVVPAKYVLEIGGGEAARHGFAVGDKIIFRGLNASSLAPTP